MFSGPGFICSGLVYGVLVIDWVTRHCNVWVSIGRVSCFITDAFLLTKFWNGLSC